MTPPPAENHADATATQDTAQDIAQDTVTLVEDVSIDGMCGVY